jgi:hypothetical protein
MTMLPDVICHVVEEEKTNCLQNKQKKDDKQKWIGSWIDRER